MVNVADRWRERNVWCQGRFIWISTFPESRNQIDLYENRKKWKFVRILVRTNGIFAVFQKEKAENTHKIECFQPWNRSAYKRFSETLVPRLSPYIRGLWCVCLRASSRQPPTPRYALLLAFVRITGLEPARDSPLEPKSSASANSAISASKHNYSKPTTIVSMLFTQSPKIVWFFSSFPSSCGSHASSMLPVSGYSPRSC